MSAQGRPRQASVEVNIAEAVLESLQQYGFADTTIDRVAKLTGYGRPTIYRRFANSDAMITASVQLLMSEAVPPAKQVGDPLQQVVEQLMSTVNMLEKTPVGPIFRAVLSELPRYPQLAALVNNVGGQRRAQLLPVVNTAIELGVLRPVPDVQVLIDGWIGAIYFRYLMTNRSLDRRYIKKLLAQATDAAPT